MISAIVPTLDEAATIGPLVGALRAMVDEVVVSDAGSGDGTVDVARAAGALVVTGARGRGPQMDLAATAARGERLWFVHADSALPAGCGEALRHARGPWGCFETRIDSEDPRLRFTGAWMSKRARRSGACSGDMGIWSDRPFFESLGGFGSLPAFEDLAFADRARRAHPCEVLQPTLGTSARRWTTDGVNRTILQFWLLRLGYRAGLDPIRLSRAYRSRPR